MNFKIGDVVKIVPNNSPVARYSTAILMSIRDNKNLYVIRGFDRTGSGIILEGVTTQTSMDLTINFYNITLANEYNLSEELFKI
jgi:hypothetical protein